MHNNLKSKTDILKNIAWLLMTLAISLSASIANIPYFDDTIKFIDEANIPETPTAFLLGGFVAAFFGVIFNIFVFVLFTALVFILNKKIMLRLFLFQKNERVTCKVWRCIGYFVIVCFIWSGIKALISYKELILSGLWFYSSAIMTAVLYTTILASVFNTEY